MAETPGLILPKQEVLNNPASKGWKAWFTSKGDAAGPPIVRGGGTPIRMTFGAPGTQSITVKFEEPIELHNGQPFWSGLWGMDDYLTVSAQLDGTVVSSTPGTGNCNLSPITGGNMLIPAPLNDGSHTVDLAAAVPVKALSGPNLGMWNADYETGDVTPVSNPGSPDGRFADRVFVN